MSFMSSFMFQLNRNSSPQIAKFATLHLKGATSGQSFVRDIEKAALHGLIYG